MRQTNRMRPAAATNRRTQTCAHSAPMLQRRTGRRWPHVCVWAVMSVALICVSATMPPVWLSVALAGDEVMDNDLELPTPSPSDLPPLVVEVEEAPLPEPAACEPLAVQPTPRMGYAVCRRRAGHRCRPRGKFGRVPRRRVLCRPCPVPPVRKSEPAEQAQVDSWKPLFDSRTLKNWKATEFGGEGTVEVRDGMIVMEMGGDMTGITFTEDPPRTNYELELEAQRLAGHDFFGTTTFPVGEEYCSLVVGGWGGTVVGLSNVDFYDASDNFTTTFKDFKNETWYHVRIRVSDHKITAWIDGEKMIEQPRAGHQFGVRFEVELNRPLGISTWQTTGAVRNIRIRRLKQGEVDADQPEA